MNALRGHSILIAESDVTPFVGALQAAIDAIGAESMVARNQEVALERCARFKFSAAMMNVEHRELLHVLGLPTVVYGTAEVPMQPQAVLVALAELLER